MVLLGDRRGVVEDVVCIDVDEEDKQDVTENNGPLIDRSKLI